MGWSKFESVGRLLAFWWWCLKYAPTGDLRKFNDAALASSVELNGNDAQKWKEAMIAACWLDRSKNRFRVHDWPQFTKRFLRDSRFNGRPDKWLEVLEVYPDMPFLVDESLKSNSTSNSRVTRRVTQTTSHANEHAINARTRMVFFIWPPSGKRLDDQQETALAPTCLPSSPLVRSP